MRPHFSQLSFHFTGSVSKAAKQTLSLFRINAGAAEWQRLLSDRIAPRVLDLVAEIPALATSGREADLKYRSDLISGYLSIAPLESSDRGFAGNFSPHFNDSDTWSGIRGALSSEHASNLLMNSLKGTV